MKYVKLVEKLDKEAIIFRDKADLEKQVIGKTVYPKGMSSTGTAGEVKKDFGMTVNKVEEEDGMFILSGKSNRTTGFGRWKLGPKIRVDVMNVTLKF